MIKGLIDLDIPNDQEYLNFEDFFKFLENEGYLNKTSKNKTEENITLVKQIWKISKCNDKMSQNSLKVILHGIYNCWPIKLINNKDKKKETFNERFE